MDELGSDYRYIVVTLVNHTVILLPQTAIAIDSYICFVILICNLIFVYFFIPQYVLTGGGLLSLD